MTRPAFPWRIRPATPDDLPVIFSLYDEAVVWLNARGITEQWGTTPVSARPHLVDEVRESVSRGYIAEDGAIAGFIEVELATPKYIASLITEDDAADGAYVHSLVARKMPPARGVGAALLNWAAQYAFDNGKTRLRLNCWAGNPELVQYYESQSFVRRSVTGQDNNALMERELVQAS